MRKVFESGRRRWRELCNALLLIFSFLLPFASLATHTDIVEASLPACCRAHGKHQCFMQISADGGRDSSGVQIAQVGEKCPCAPSLAQSFHHDSFSSGDPDRLGVHFSGEEPPLIDLESSGQLSSSRANHKRGPPVSSLIA